MKQGDEIRLIEVKAKSFESRKGSDAWWTKKVPRRIKSDILSCLQDIALQTYVFQLAFPGFRVSSELMLPTTYQMLRGISPDCCGSDWCRVG